MSSAETQRFYDSQKNRLVYIRQQASEEFWDELWKQQDLDKIRTRPPKHRWMTGITRRYLPPPARVLEGGCGKGDKVRALALAGYETIGLDYAPKTVAWANETWDVGEFVQGDVRHLNYPDDHFDGYWSLGVIEHFYDGYDEILAEMRRVVRPGGIVFCTFPAMTAVRQRKAKAGGFPAWSEGCDEQSDFYQFALDPQRVASDFKALGFRLRKLLGVGAISGLNAESKLSSALTRPLVKFAPGLFSKANVLLDPLIGLQSGHTALLVLENT